ncbi:GGDEF domain-containing protein [Roseomonas aerophila]|uniref:diguanylate cyclase n=1 Tax=Teichococcus aerophilus TaxID=1224513 RepID=A0ABR7RIL0_9PROT|nr:GGDEF domain-containing protein [Pseudoroseomonas aerophila]MBC9205945.1 GGDEF domain-containing protein [Pseudoroseomonas aerophila]
MDASLKRYRDTVVNGLFIAGLIAAMLMWGLETYGGVITPVDRVAYPAMVAVYTAVPVLFRFLPRHRPVIELVAYAAVAGYFAVHLTAIVLGGSDRSIYATASILQWLPFLYVVAFVVFRRSVARIAAACVFAVSVIPPILSMLWLGTGLGTETGLLLLNAYAANFVLLATLTLITALYEGYERVSRQARHMTSIAQTDMLTGIANRRGLEHLLRGVGAEGGRSVGLILLDFDHFKSVNDRFGHLIGDELLVMLARRMKLCLLPHERAGRWGGEEFLVVVLDGNVASTLETAERLRQAVEAESHPVAGQVTISLGVALWDGGGGMNAALAQADAALYAAKAQGRNRVVIQQPTRLAA